MAPVLVALLTQKIFNRRTAVVGAILYAVYPEHVFYSHYVWSELLFGLLALGAVYFFFCFLEAPKKEKLFVACFALTGIALMTKEFAVFIFGSLIVAFLCAAVGSKLRRTAIACMLFLSLASVYSAAASAITARVILLNDAVIYNFSAAAGFPSDELYSFEKREEIARKILATLRNTKLEQYSGRFKTQFFHLWSPNSFPIVRLIGRHRPDTWSYGMANPWVPVHLLAGYHIAVIAIGIAGLCLAKIDHFWIFSVTCLCGLSALGFVAFLCSRFRLPFMFIPIIYAAHLLVDRSVLVANFRNVLRSTAFVLLIGLLACIIAAMVPLLGEWG